MKVRFFGAAREVTGSMHMLESGGDRVLLDCGMFQGRRQESEEKNRHLAVEAESVTNIVLSHAHIDHCGRYPLLAKNGFKGQLICTRATADALYHLLLDSAHIQESDAEYLNYKSLRGRMMDENGLSGKQRSGEGYDRIRKMLKKNGQKIDAESVLSLMGERGMKAVEPLYTIEDVERSLGQVQTYPYRTPIQVGRNMEVELFEAGHILGSAMVLVRVREEGRVKRILFSGDLGRFSKPILRDPNLKFDPEDRNIDLLIIESTYGNRLHDEMDDLKPALQRIISKTLDRGGSVLVPAFAYGRTQELLYTIHELMNDRQIPKVPVYVDSPLASKLTRVYGEHPELYDRETHETFLQKGQNPFYFSKVRFVETVEESMRLNRDMNPHIVLSASGMCEAGRILHHLRFKIHDSRHTVLIVGFMAEHTLGRRILDLGTQREENGREGPAPMVRILGKEYPLKAHVATVSGFSAHADRNELLRFLHESGITVAKTAVVHGEVEQSRDFRDRLAEEGMDAFVPGQGDGITL